MSNNKIVCVHITREEVRLLEGRVNQSIMLVTHTAVVPKANRFFSGERLAYMSELVTAIIDTMNVNSFTARQVCICYDNGLDVSYFLDDKLLRKQEKRGIQINFNFGKKKDDSGDAKDAAAMGGVISHKKSWGQYITESDKGEMWTTTVIERDLVNFMISEFQEHGIKVISIEAPGTALIYLRQFVPFSYDALHKLVVFSNDRSSGVFYQFTKDAFAGEKALHFEDIIAETFAEQCVGVIKEEIQKSSLRNPHIMLVGSAFDSTEEYIEICNLLKEDGIVAIDLYGTWHDMSCPLNSVRVITPQQDMDMTINGSFGICISLLAREMESKPENLVEGFHPMFLRKETRAFLTNTGHAAAVLFLVYNLVFTGIGVYENYVAEQEYKRASNTTEAQLTIATKDRDAVKIKVDNLGTIDSRYNEIFRFVYEQVSDNLNIASVDTIDMIPSDTTTSSGYTGDAGTTDPAADSSTTDQTAASSSTTDGTTDAAGNAASSSSSAAPTTQATQPAQDQVVDVTGSSDASNYAMKTIVIRGYSRTSDGPVDLYNALVSAGLGEVKVVGVEQVTLPSQESIFAFELTVGTNEGEAK